MPPGVDYDLWTGPAPMRPFTKNRFHYNWHWFWDTGNGDIGNQGIHEVDIARWGLGVTHPDEGQRDRRQVHVRRRPGDAEHAELRVRVQRERQDEDDGFEVRHWYSNHEAGIDGERPGNTIGNIVLRLQGLPGHRQLQQVLQLPGRRTGAGSDQTEGDNHFANFIEAVRSRKREDLNAEIEEGAMSCMLVHLANISYRLGRTLNWDEKTWTVKSDAEANKMLTREYRKPYVVPEKV